MADLGDDTVTVIRAGRINDHGAQVPSWAAATTTDIKGCSVQPGVGREDRFHRDAALVAFTVYLPPDTDVTSDDRLRFRGHDHEIIDVNSWADPDLGHVKVLCQAWRDLGGA